jgi:hypothetical protein
MLSPIKPIGSARGSFWSGEIMPNRRKVVGQGRQGTHVQEAFTLM